MGNKRELKVLQIVLGAFSIAYIGIVAAVIALRMSYPYELEWMEGAIVDHVARLLDGLPIYVEPSLDFTPFVYAPLYYYVAALFAKLFGLSLFPLRLVSVISTIITFWLLFKIVMRETERWTYGLIAIGMYAASFHASGSWFDIARGDSLFLMLLVAGVYVYRYHRESLLALILSSVFFTLSVFTKQSALIAVIPILIVAVWQERGKALWVIAPFVFLTTTGVMLFESMTDGWFLYYTLIVPESHGILTDQIIGFWTSDILGHAAVALLLSVVFLVSSLRQKLNTDNLLWAAAFVGCFAVAWSGRIHSGGYLNVLLPAFWILALVSTLAINKWSQRSKIIGLKAAPTLLILGVVQFAMLWFNPANEIPTSEDRSAGDRIVASLHTVDGDVFMPFHGWYTRLAGKGIHAHKMALGDVERADSAMKAALDAAIRSNLAEHSFDLIVIDAAWHIEELGAHYVSTGNATGETRNFYPVTGFRTRPKHWLVPRNGAPSRLSR